MRFSYVAALAIFAAPYVAAALESSPQTEARNEVKAKIEERGSGLGVFLCTGNEWSGNCKHRTKLERGQVYAVEWESNDLIKSFGPDKGTRCTLCVHHDCTLPNQGGFSDVIWYPGVSNLGDWWGRVWDQDNQNGASKGQGYFNGKVSAFICYSS
ncbi:hypothetical protein TWF696_007030 [Orbilia brochopaga]|uniref:Uncharacterized protein n=1 Tax=Orbilia brochopaga TaxID=3140254 RepID=A0AAV9UQM7_9PEZI